MRALQKYTEEMEPLESPRSCDAINVARTAIKAENTLVAPAAWSRSGGQEVTSAVLGSDKYILESEYANGCTPLETHKYYHVVHFKWMGLSQTSPEAYFLSDYGACGVDRTHGYRCY